MPQSLQNLVEESKTWRKGEGMHLRCGGRDDDDDVGYDDVFVKNEDYNVIYFHHHFSP